VGSFKASTCVQLRVLADWGFSRNLSILCYMQINGHQFTLARKSILTTYCLGSPSPDSGGGANVCKPILCPCAKIISSSFGHRALHFELTNPFWRERYRHKRTKTPGKEGFLVCIRVYLSFSQHKSFENKVETPYHDIDLILTLIISSQSGWQWTWSCLELHMGGFSDEGW